MTNKCQHVIEEALEGCLGFASPIPFKNLSKIKGSPERHIEQLWDEVNKLKARIKLLEKNKVP